MNLILGTKRGYMWSELIVETLDWTIGGDSQQRLFSTPNYRDRQFLSKRDFLCQQIEVLRGQVGIIRPRAKFSIHFDISIGNPQIVLICDWIEVEYVLLLHRVLLKECWLRRGL